MVENSDKNVENINECHSIANLNFICVHVCVYILIHTCVYLTGKMFSCDESILLVGERAKGSIKKTKT